MMTNTAAAALLVACALVASARYAGAADYCSQNVTAGELRMTDPSATADQLSTSLNKLWSVAPAGSCTTFKLTKTTLLNPDAGCVGDNKWLLLELYVMRRTDQAGGLVVDTTPAAPGRIAFMASREYMPSVQFMPNSDSYVPQPPLNAPEVEGYRGDKIGNGGLYLDRDATGYDRWYHRLLIPNVTSTPKINDVWWVTVSNLDPSDTALQGFSIRATCLPASQVPCARPFPNAGSCSLPANASHDTVAQTCIQRSVSNPGSSYCRCNSTSGDYGCNRPVTSVVVSGTSVQLSVPSSNFAIFKVTVPTQSPSPSSNVLLAEFTRSPSSSSSSAPGGGSQGTSSFGADPLLLVKPVDTSERNTPYWVDATSWADNSDWALLQSYHYIMRRDIQSSNNEWYVAVGNYRQRFKVDTVLTGTLTLRWGTPGRPFVCPRDCSGRGVCVDPRGATGLPSYGLGDGSPGFVCNCSPGYGGMYCDGPLQTVTLSTTAQTMSGVVAPSQWSYLQVNIDQRRFSYRVDSLVVNWKSSDPLGTLPLQQVNSLLTLNEDQFPQQGQYVPPGGNNYYLVASYPGANGRLPFEVMGSRMRQGASYLIGVYNSEYQRSVQTSFSVDVYMPMPSSSWLRPYMSVVLGITAAIVLCLFMTLCKRVVLRQGWGPWGRAQAQLAATRRGHMLEDGLDVNGMPRHAMLQIMPRHQGVPVAVVDSFPTYSYVAPNKTLDTSSASGTHNVPVDAAAVGLVAVGAAAAAGAGGAAGGEAGNNTSSNTTTTNNNNNNNSGAAEAAAALRTQREALQAAAAEAATTAAAAVMAIAHQQQQQQQQQDGEDRASAAAGGHGVGGVAGGAAAGGAAQVQVQDEAATAAMASAAAKAAAAAHHRRDPLQLQQGGADGGAVGTGPSAAGAAGGGGGGGGGVGGPAAASSGEAGGGAALPGGVGGAPIPLVAAAVDEAKLPPLPDEDAPACTVCLCEYEEGDLMRRLPCGHEFHRACIDKWMTQHVTCPMCREPLVSPEELQRMQEAAAQQGGTHVAVIYIPQSLRRQAATNRSASGSGGTALEGGGAGAGGGQGSGVWDSLSRMLRTSSRRQDGAIATPLAPGGGSQQQTMGLQLAGSGQWRGPSSTAASGSAAVPGGMMHIAGAGGGGALGMAEAGAVGWHVTRAWGSTDPGGDPFASPLPMTGGGGSVRSSSARRLQQQRSASRGIGSRGGSQSSAAEVASAGGAPAAAAAQVQPPASGGRP